MKSVIRPDQREVHYCVETYRSGEDADQEISKSIHKFPFLEHTVVREGNKSIDCESSLKSPSVDLERRMTKANV